MAHGKAYLLLTATAAMWGGNAIAGKLAVGHISPFLLTTCRWLLALIIILPFAWKYLRKDQSVIIRRLPFLFLMGTAGFTLFNNLLYLALNHTSAINAAIEQASIPLLIVVLNFLWFRDRVRFGQIAGFFLTLSGVAVTVTAGSPLELTRLAVNIGDAMMMLAVLAYAAYSVALIRKPSMHWISLFSVMAACALIASLPFTLWEFAAGRAILPDSNGLLVILYAAVLASVLAQNFWIRGLEYIGSTRAGVFINLVPIFAAAMALTLLGEKFETYHVVGAVLVFSGVLLVQHLQVSRSA